MMSVAGCTAPRAVGARVTDPAEDVLLTPAETAALLRVHVETLRRWRKLGYGPAYIRVGHGYRYWRSVVLEWLNAESER